MPLESNYGSMYYAVSCGIPSSAGVNVNSNIATGYYRISANEFILWGQPTHYTHVQANSGSAPYFLECNVPSDVGLNLQSNAGTKYYYSSSFNCVSFCS